MSEIDLLQMQADIKSISLRLDRMEAEAKKDRSEGKDLQRQIDQLARLIPAKEGGQRIDDLMESLAHIRAEHGNIRCVTPAMDESGIADLDTPEVIRIVPYTHNMESTGACHETEDENAPQIGLEYAVKLNFD